MTRRTGIAVFIAIAISSLLFGCTKQKLEPMTKVWVSPYYISNWVYNAEGKYLHTGADGEVTADSTMEILHESTWPMGVTASMPKYLIPDTAKLVNEADDQWLELTANGFRLKGKVTSYNARGHFKQAAFPSADDFYYKLTGEQESDLRVYWQDNTLRIVSESPGEVTLHLKDLRDTYQFPAGGCAITDFADGKIIVK